MIVLKAVEKQYSDVDESGQPVTRSCLEPEKPIPATAVRTICDGANYIVYEQGD